jgi:hypothetical protein
VVNWSGRRWLAAAVAAIGSALVLGVPTAVIPNPVFGRGIAAPAWTVPSLVVTSVLAGLLLATYVREAPVGDLAGGGLGGLGGSGTYEAPTQEESRRLTAGGLLSFLAVGCPTCNKLVLLALGSSGAITWFEPVQPLLAVAGIVLLAWALRRRLTSERSCTLPVG